ncbi:MULTISPECIES: oxalate/formate MFS antiporter [unclassified Pseudomonas]|uniref:oxalate/formate MFS antiporter n=1 Tax=unclassified Pseudomonas TaxID=196821 RepID=UPI001C5B655B|nr:MULTISPECIES: oxalate/formate MFS antiporter [unclassified Pseudomonas]MBW3504510.1 oxalate/formate MFS antiporter [Pseudomonas sp. NKUCC02_KPG]MEC4167681.1 oxalate/formate MFS antiporter [Pseudomonas sp. MS-1(2024)]
MNREQYLAESTRVELFSARGYQLVIGVICMMAISSPQYVWTLFTAPLTEKLGVSLAQVQITFSLLIILQTFFSPVQGYLVDRFGIRTLVGLGCALSGLSWILASQASSLSMLYLSYGVVGGLGTGIVYVGIIGLMVRWFPDRRGLAAGAVAAGYGMGAMITTFPISNSLKSAGMETTMLTFGLALGLVGLVASRFLRQPPTSQSDDPLPKTKQIVVDVPPREVLKTPVFWLMFAMFTMMSTSGLMVTSQMASFAEDFGMTSVMVMGMAALPLALTIDRICNGLTRPLFGWISDRYGRENTMAFAFFFEGIAMTLWLLTSDNPVLFVLLSGVVFLGWGEIFSLFPSTLTDTFGTRHATTNYGFLYMAQGIGSIFGGPVAALLHQSTDSWYPVFAVAISFDIITAGLAFFVLKRMRANWIAKHAMKS